MNTVVIELDVPTSERARRLAGERGTTVEALVRSLITQLDMPETEPDPLLGLFADDPMLLDQIVEQAMQSRETERPRFTDA